MDREIPFDEKAICDGCGAVGAFDFIGDFFCPKCLAKDEDTPPLVEFLLHPENYPASE